MTNPYYTKTFNAIPLTVIPSSAHNAQYALVEDGFDAVDVDIQALDLLKAPLSSPVFTDIPRVPTAALGTSTTQASSTEFVQQAIAAVNAVASFAVPRIDATATITVAPGEVVASTNVGTVAATFPPAPVVGVVCGLVCDNGLFDNTIDLGPNSVMLNGVSISGLVTNGARLPFVVRWYGDYWRFF